MSETKPGHPLETSLEQAARAVAVSVNQLERIEGGAAAGAPLQMDALLPVPVQITVEVGRTRLTLADVLALAPGSLVTLDREAHEPVDILVNGKLVARGEVVTIDDQFGVRVTEVESG